MEKKYQKKDKYKLNEPILYPPLRQNIANLDVDEDKFNDIGILTLRLLRQNEMSVYKLLYNRETNTEFLTSNNTNKSVRSDYLKKIVEANEVYFPRELQEEKYKRRDDLTFDEKLKSKIQFKESKTKKEKGNKDLNKKANTERKESIDIAEVGKTQNGNKKSKANEPVNVIEEDEDQIEENEEQSFEEDDFLMNSEDEAGSNNEEANYSEGD